MLHLYLFLFSALIVAADQVTKYLTVLKIPYGGHQPFLHGFVCLTYAQNTGGGWSILSDHTWVLIAVSVVFMALIAFAIWRKFFTSKAQLICLFAILGGGVGNLIDRVRLGYVVDMIETEFISFPVFNVADCFISCGAIALIFFVLFEDVRKGRKKA